MFNRYIHLCVGKIEMHDERVVYCKHSVSVKFLDYLYGMSTA